MGGRIAVGIDIGTYTVKVAVSELVENEPVPRLIGTGYAESKGLRHGYIINADETVKSIRKAVKEAQDEAGVQVRRAFISVGGVSIEGIKASGSVIINRPEPEITAVDAERALKAAERQIPRPSATNRKILHTIPISYKLDGQPVLGQPIGLNGNKLEVQALFITCLEQHLNDLIQAVEDAGVEVEDVAAAPLAASFVSLTKAQKIAGCVLANIGAETVSIVVYENNIPVSIEVFPLGSTDITNDIALGFQVDLDEAEKLKIGTRRDQGVSKRKLDEIIKNRLEAMFALIEAHLEKIGRNKLLPAGIIISGGGSGLAKIEDMAKTSLSLPSRIVQPSLIKTNQNRIKDATWAVAYGLCILGLSEPEEEEEENETIFNVMGTAIRKAGMSLRRLLP